MSHSASSSNQKRSNRWGAAPREDGPSKASEISDEAALQALLASASQADQQRQAAAKQKREGTSNHRRREDSSKDGSYYGPNINNHQRRNDDRGGPRRNVVEDEDDRPSKRKREWGTSEQQDNDTLQQQQEGEDVPKKEHKPNFGLSGALAKDMKTGNVYKGVTLKFREPPEARAPAKTLWRFYVYKDGSKDVLETLHVSRQSAYLFGRNTEIADIPLLHPSCSSQHCVLQYRAVPKDGDPTKLHVQPYLMDLESTNGSFINGVRIDPARYYQLKKGDVLRFGASTREYVLLATSAT